MKQLKKISYRTLPGMVADSLRVAILSGELSGGTQLKQDELATKFSVSMSALREGLKSLEAEGLVRFHPNRGVAVTELSADEAREIFDIRLFMELGALELAVPHLTEADFERAAEVLRQADNEPRGERWGALNWQFHEILYRPANRPRLLELIRQQVDNVERYMRLYLSTMHFQTRSQEQHWALLAACRRRLTDEAKAILREHMAEASRNLGKYLAQQHS